MRIVTMNRRKAKVKKRALQTPARRHNQRSLKNSQLRNTDSGAIPTHLRVHNAAGPVPVYEPRPGNRPPPGAERVDVATSKPVFVPRGERET